MRLFIVLALAIALITVIFALQNMAPVIISIFGWQFEGSLALVLLATLAIGVIVGLLVSAPSVIRRSWKLSSKDRRLEDLKWQIQEKEREISSQKQGHRFVQHQTHTLLDALGMTDAQTGLLKGELVNQELAYLLRQMAYAPDEADSRSVCVYEIELSRDSADHSAANPALSDAELKAAAQVLQNQAPADVWLHHQGVGQFACIATGLDSKAALELGEHLRDAIADQSLSLGDGSTLSAQISVGAAIADISTPIDSPILLQQAKEAMEHAKRRGRNRFRLVQAKA